jgi:hypothetical protein
MPLIDFYGDFATGAVACEKCGWTGIGSEMKSGESFGDGTDKHCPACGERWGFVQWSVTVIDNPPLDWKATIGRIEI